LPRAGTPVFPIQILAQLPHCGCNSNGHAIHSNHNGTTVTIVDGGTLIECGNTNVSAGIDGANVIQHLGIATTGGHVLPNACVGQTSLASSSVCTDLSAETSDAYASSGTRLASSRYPPFSEPNSGTVATRSNSCHNNGNGANVQTTLSL